LLCNLLSNSHRLTQTLLPSGYSVNKFNQIPGISYLIAALHFIFKIWNKRAMENAKVYN
jgi:hypothetical protein